MKKVTDITSFTEKASKIHNGKYTYRKAVYIDSYSQITITCKRHGEFSQKANNHLIGKGCPKCAIESRIDYKTVKKSDITKAGLKISTDLPSTLYHGRIVDVECKVHGTLTVKANSAIKGCHWCAKVKSRNEYHKKCRGDKLRNLIADLVIRFGDQYDVSNATFIDAKTPLRVVCKDHGKFMASPNRLTCGKLKGKIKTIPCKECRANGRYKIVTVGGKQFEYLGYEDKALKFLVEEKGIHPDDIYVGREVPRILLDLKLRNGKKKIRHFPDIFVKSKNLLIEVKSQATFGFTEFYGNNNDRIKTIQHKSIKAKEAGFDYRVMLFIKRSRKDIARQPLPKNWDTMSLIELKGWFKATRSQTGSCSLT